jgi:hypothetical protein
MILKVIKQVYTKLLDGEHEINLKVMNTLCEVFRGIDETGVYEDVLNHLFLRECV